MNGEFKISRSRICQYLPDLTRGQYPSKRAGRPGASLQPMNDSCSHLFQSEQPQQNLRHNDRRCNSSATSCTLATDLSNENTYSSTPSPSALCSTSATRPILAHTSKETQISLLNISIFHDYLPSAARIHLASRHWPSASSSSLTHSISVLPQTASCSLVLGSNIFLMMQNKSSISPNSPG